LGAEDLLDDDLASSVQSGPKLKLDNELRSKAGFEDLLEFSDLFSDIADDQ
jgi:hypothetical protein